MSPELEANPVDNPAVAKAPATPAKKKRTTAKKPVASKKAVKAAAVETKESTVDSTVDAPVVAKPKTASFLQRYFAHASVALFAIAGFVGLQATGSLHSQKTKDVFVPVVSMAQVEEHYQTALKAGLPAGEATREQIKEFLASNLVIEHEAKVSGILDDPVMRDRLTTTRFAILAEAVIQADAAKNPVDPKFVRENYDMQKAAYSTQEYQLRHIAVNDEETAKKVYQELKEGLDFIKAVQTYTIDNDKIQDGWLGWLKANQLGDEMFRKTVILLKKGEFSSPIKTAKAWQIVKLEDARELKPFPSFEEQKGRIEKVLSQRQAEMRLTEKVKAVQFK